MGNTTVSRLLPVAIIATLLGGCDLLTNQDDGKKNAGISVADAPDWLIPVDEIFDGGPGKDGIPALSDPLFGSASDDLGYGDYDLVVGIRIGTETRAYPHDILDWHEIINDQIGDSVFALTYCPLTGTGIAWNRNLGGEITTFGVSGLLYNANLLPYDRATDSYWSQMQLRCVNGEHLGATIETFPVVQTSLKTWREMYPRSLLMTTETGYNRSYGRYPYGSYRTSTRLIFPADPLDDRLPRKERVLGVIVGNSAKVYRLLTFPDSVHTINDEFAGVAVIAAGMRTKQLAVVYGRELPDGTVLTFEPLQGHLPAIMRDNEGTNWDVFGRAMGGARKGQELPRLQSFIGYWFAWGAFYPDAEIYAD